MAESTGNPGPLTNQIEMPWLLLVTLVYLGSTYTMPLSRWFAPLLCAALAASSLPPRKALACASGACLLSHLLAPPQWVRWNTFYYEEWFVDWLNRGHSGGLQGLLLSLLLTLVATSALSHREWSDEARRKLGLAGLVLIVLGQLLVTLVLGSKLPAKFSREPLAQSYQNDGMMSLKALHRYRSGEDYYRAYRTAFQGDKRGSDGSLSGQSLRTPVFFWLVSLLPSPAQIPLVLWCLTSLVQCLIYFASRDIMPPQLALVVPLLLGGYWLYAQVMDCFVLMTDVWAGLLLIAAVAVAGMRGWAGFFVLAALATLLREFVALPLLLCALGVMVRQPGPRVRIALSGLLLGLLGCYLWHLQLTRSQAGMTEVIPVSSRLMGSPEFALATLRHGTILWGGRDAVWPLLAFLSLVALRGLRHQLWFVAPLLGCQLLFVVFCRVGAPDAQYYGLIYAPIIYWSAFLQLGAWCRESQPDQLPL